MHQSSELELPPAGGGTEALGRRHGELTRWAERIRIRHWWHFLLLPLASAPRVLDGDALVALGRGVAVAFCVLAFGYLHNGIADRHMDLDTGKNPLVSHRRVSSWAPLIPMSLALALAFTGPLECLIATAITLVSGWVYSGGPRLKRFPVLGSLLNLTHFVPLLWVGMPATSTPRPLMGLGLALCGLLLQSQLIHEGQDQVEDARGGLRTTFSILGGRGAAVVAAAAGAWVGFCAVRFFSVPWPGVALLVVVFTGVLPVVFAYRARRPAALPEVRTWQRHAAMLTGAALLLSAW